METTKLNIRFIDKFVNWFNSGAGVSVSYRNPTKASIEVSGSQNERIGYTSPILSSTVFNGGSQNDLNITGTYATTNITDFKIVIDNLPILSRTTNSRMDIIVITELYQLLYKQFKNLNSK